MSSNWRQDMPSAEAYWIDRVLYDIHHRPADLQRYLSDPKAYLQDFPISDANKASMLANNIGAMYLAGANPYLLRAHSLGLHIPEPTFLASIRAVAEEACHG